jgi:glucose/arabinose dehydrogenase
VQFAFDAEGRMWLTTMPSYPMYLPGHPVDDKVLILEDTDHDGKADEQIIFARGLHVPTGIELGDGGAYVANQPNLLFLIF